MSDFKQKIKVLENKRKEKIFYTVFTDYLQNGLIGRSFKKEEILKQVQNKYGQMISQDEIIAISVISEQLNLLCIIQGYYYEGRQDRKDFIDFIYANHKIRIENVLKLVEATVEDIVGDRKFTNHKEYCFNVNHVLDIINGKDPYKIQRQEQSAEEARKKFKVIK